LETKKQKADLRLPFDNYVISFEEELKANLECMHDNQALCVFRSSADLEITISIEQTGHDISMTRVAV
jgi:hypothetical protein